MSKAYYFCKNFNFKEIMNLMRYSSKNPETLTSTQKATRLYRSSLRKIYAFKLQGFGVCFKQFNEEVNKCSRDFEKIISLPLDSAERTALIFKWEKYQEDLYDPNVVIDECRPYAPAASRYLVWDDNALSFDPFGYYKKRLLSDKYPEGNMPYYEDYPMVDSHWNIFETFPEGFDDTDTAPQEVSRSA